MQLSYLFLLACASTSRGAVEWTRVGNLVHHVPTAVSHQQATIVHNSEPFITPLLTPIVSHPRLLSPSIINVQEQYPSTWRYYDLPSMYYATQNFRK